MYNITNKYDLMDIHGALHPVIEEYTFFSNTHSFQTYMEPKNWPHIEPQSGSKWILKISFIKIAFLRPEELSKKPITKNKLELLDQKFSKDL